MVQVIIECVKNAAKTNLTFTSPANSITETVNITGRAVKVIGYTLRGEDVSEYVVNSRFTVCFTEKQGNALLDKTKEIFAQRLANDDYNPIIALQLQLEVVNQTSSGYLGYEVTKMGIVNNYKGEQGISVSEFKKQAQAIRLQSSIATEKLLSSGVSRPQLRQSLNSTRVMESMLNSSEVNADSSVTA